MVVDMESTANSATSAIRDLFILQRLLKKIGSEDFIILGADLSCNAFSNPLIAALVGEEAVRAATA